MDPLSGFALVLTHPVNVPTSRNALARAILAHLERDEDLVQGEIFPRFLANLEQLALAIAKSLRNLVDFRFA